jgi:hypothetical protein
MGLSKFWQAVVDKGEYKTHVGGNEAMIARADALKFIDRELAGIVILGAEGFKFDGKHIIPIMDCILNASGATVEESHQVLIKLLESDENWKQPDFIAFTLDMDE